MSIYNITFSPTGGTQKVADLVTNAFSAEPILLDLTDRRFDFSTISFQSADICIVAVPAYGGRVPQIAISRLEQLTGNNAKAILIAVYGNRAYEDTLLELQDTLIVRNFQCIAAIAAIAEHSIMHQFAAGRPNDNDAKELGAIANKILQTLESTTAFSQLLLPGNTPYREFNGVPMKPSVGKHCTNCGLCATKCPVGAIPNENPSKTDETACISCMRCIAICPNKARKVNQLLITMGAQKMKKACSEYRNNECFLSDSSHTL